MLRREMAGDRPLNPVRPVSSLSIGPQPIRLPNQVQRVSDDDECLFSASSKKKKHVEDTEEVGSPQLSCLGFYVTKSTRDVGHGVCTRMCML